MYIRNSAVLVEEAEVLAVAEPLPAEPLPRASMFITCHEPNCNYALNIVETLKELKVLDLSSTQVTDAGCATLATALDSGALPALERLFLIGTPASAAGKTAVCAARASLECYV